MPLNHDDTDFSLVKRLPLRKPNIFQSATARPMLIRYFLAMHSYQHAARLAPNDPSPSSNLSAVHFEVGDYASAVDASDKALALLEDRDKRQKLYFRKAKARVYTKQYEKALEAVKQLSEGQEKHELRKYTEANVNSQQAMEATAADFEDIVMKLPRYKPQMYVPLSMP